MFSMKNLSLRDSPLIIPAFLISYFEEIEFIERSSVSPIETSEKDASILPETIEFILASQKTSDKDDFFPS